MPNLASRRNYCQTLGFITLTKPNFLFLAVRPVAAEISRSIGFAPFFVKTALQRRDFVPMSKVDDIIQQLKELSLMEASELVAAIETTFGVSASAPVVAAGVAAPAAVPTAEAPAEKTEFTVTVREVPADKKIPVIKVVKNVLNIGLADAKAKVEAAPFVLLEKVSKEDAEKCKQELVEAGATVQVD